MAGVNLQHLVMKTGGELLVGGDFKSQKKQWWTPVVVEKNGSLMVVKYIYYF